MSLNSSGFILVKIELMSQTTTIKAEPYKTLLEIKNKSLKILNDSKKTNLHLFYKNKDLVTKEHEQIGNVFPKREKVFLTLMGPSNNPNYIKKKINEIHREIKKHDFNENDKNVAQNLNENINDNSSSFISDDNNKKNNNKNNEKNNEINDNNNNDNNDENQENQRKEGKKISIINHKIVTKNKMIFSLMDNNKNKDYDNINEQYKIKHKKNSNNKEHNNNENNNNENNNNENNNENNNNENNNENNENKNNKKLKFSIKEELEQKNKIFSPMKSTRNPLKKKLFLKTFNLTNNDNSIEKSQNTSLNDIKNKTVNLNGNAKENEEKKEKEEDFQAKLNKRQEFNRLVKKSLTSKTLKKKSIDNNNNNNNNNKEDSNNNNENINKSPIIKNNIKSENKLAFNSILKNNILSTNTLTSNNNQNNNNNNNKDNKNKSTNSLQDFSNILTRTNKIKPSFLKSINQEINSMNFMCNCNNNKISFYCRICQDFLCYKCRESFNHQDHLAINIDIKNIENNISLYAIIIQNDIEEKILCNKKYYKSFKENKNYLYTENKNKILESKIKILTNIYNKLFGKLQEILKTKFVDEVEMILNEYNLNAKIIGGKIINILKQIEVFKQNKDKKKLTYEEFQKFFKILNEKEKELNSLEDNILLYKVNYELNEKLIRFYDNIERQLNLLININTPFNLNKKYIDFLKNINKFKFNNNNNNLSNYYTNYTTNFSSFNNLNGFNNKGINKKNNNNNSPNNTNNVNNFAFDEKFENEELFDEEFIKMNFVNFEEENDENKITVNNKKNSILLNSLNNLNNKKMIKNKGIFKKNTTMKLEKKFNTKKSLSPIDPNRNIEGKEKIINNSHINLTLASPLKKKNFNKSEKINIKKI